MPIAVRACAGALCEPCAELARLRLGACFSFTVPQGASGTGRPCMTTQAVLMANGLGLSSAMACCSV